MQSHKKYRLYFIGAFFLGTLAIIFSPLTTGDVSLWFMRLPLIVMLVYCALIWKKGKGSEESGDSLYYLGFAFTLVALMVAMSGVVFNEESIKLRQIVKAFGIALSTTALGLIGRVLLLSFVDDRIERDAQEVAHQDAMFALGLLQTEVGSTVQILSQWRTDAVEHWRDVREAEITGVRGIIETQQKLLADAYSDLGKCAEKAISQIGTVAEESTNQVKLVAQSGVVEIASSCSAVRDGVVGSFSGISKQLEQELCEVQDNARSVASTLTEVTKEFEQSTLAAQKALGDTLAGLVREVEKTAGSIGKDVAVQIEESFTKVGQVSDKLADAVAGAAHHLTELRFDRVNQALGEVQTAANETRTAFARVGKELKNAGSAMGIDQVRISIQSLAQSMSQHHASLAAVGGSLAQVSGDLSQVAQGVNSYATGIKNVAAEFTNELKDISKLRLELSEVRQGLTEDLMSSQQVLRRVMNTLSEGVQQLRREIDSKE